MIASSSTFRPHPGRSVRSRNKGISPIDSLSDKTRSSLKRGDNAADYLWVNLTILFFQAYFIVCSQLGPYRNKEDLKIQNNNNVNSIPQFQGSVYL